MKKTLPLTVILGLTTVFGTAQELKRCSSYEYMMEQIAKDPESIKVIEELDAISEAQSRLQAPVQTNAVVTIPVVFHVVYQNSTENISSTRLMDQLTVLNADYRMQNTDASNIPAAFQPFAADCEVNFCLANVDPSGNPTTGITRTLTTVTSFSTDDAVKYTAQGGMDAWDRSKYLNIWVCDLGSSLLGYAQFPGIGSSATDGVVLHYKFTGTVGSTSPYNKGRTATHEVGHWLGLRHIWGDDGTSCSGSDGIADTPNQADETYGCYTPGTIRLSCSNTPDGDMWMNYMDYTNDACMYMFTAGQKSRISTVLNGTRGSLKTSPGCSAVSVNDLIEGNISVYPSPTSGEVFITAEFMNLNNLKVRVLNTLGEVVKEEAIPYINGTYALDLSGNTNGVYFVELSNDTEKAIRKVILSR